MFVQRKKKGRTLKEQIIDKFLLMYLINDAREGVGDTKLQKLAYLSELDMILQGRKGFNYTFIKMPYGPYSKDLENDVKDLMKCGVISGYSHAIRPRGRKILKSFQHLVESNSILVEKIHNVNRKYLNISRDELVEKVHKMPNPVRPTLSIDDTRRGSYLLKRMRLAHADRVFKMDESDLASLEILFDPKNLGAMINALKEAKSKPSVKLSDVLNVV